MSEKHTPGPWAQHFEKPRVIVSVHNPRMSLLGLDSADTAIVFNHADARLIAAAPELLEALRNLVGWAEEMLPDDNDGSVLAQSRAAIAKATRHD